MNLSNSRRFVKLGLHLLTKPWRIPNYLKTSLSSRNPLELELPWWSNNAIYAIDRWVTSKTKVFEYGTGGSTLFLARRTLSVECVEDDAAWLAKTQEALEANGLNNTTLNFAPFDFANLDNFEQSPYLHNLRKGHDLIVVDGQDNYHFEQKLSARTLCFRHAQKFISPRGIILVDDSWRYPEIRKTSRCKKLVIHESAGPCRRGVTSTDIHYF